LGGERRLGTSLIQVMILGVLDTHSLFMDALLPGRHLSRWGLCSSVLSVVIYRRRGEKQSLCHSSLPFYSFVILQMPSSFILSVHDACSASTLVPILSRTSLFILIQEKTNFYLFSAFTA